MTDLVCSVNTLSAFAKCPIGEIGRKLGDMWRSYSDSQKAVCLHLVSSLYPRFHWFFGGKMNSPNRKTPLWRVMLSFSFFRFGQRTNTFSSFFVVNVHCPSPTTPSTRRPRPLTPRRRLPMTPRRPTPRMMTMMRTRMSPTKPVRGCFSDLCFLSLLSREVAFLDACYLGR